jgi:N-acetyl sugar amidotransferase
MSKTYQMCVRCVMDTSDPEIVFDSAGMCQHCKNYFRRAPTLLFTDGSGSRRLSNLTDEMRRLGKGREYDCIIGVSGGVDSTYVAYRVKELGLRPLAIHLDNGWDSALAVTNIRKTLDVLDIDLHTDVLDWDEFKDLQLAFLRASTPDSEIPTDHAITAVLLQMAAKHGIKHIVTGSNYATEAIMPASWSQGINDWKYISTIAKRFGTVPLRTFPHFTLADYMFKTQVQRIRFVRILNFVPYVKADAMRIIEKELGWTYYGGKHYESVYTRFFQAYILPRKFGFDKRRGHLSTLICSGQMSRSEALALLEDEICDPKLLEADKEFVIKKLGITQPEFDDIMQATPRVFRDYPSYENSFPYAPAIRLVRKAKESLYGKTADEFVAPESAGIPAQHDGH